MGKRTTRMAAALLVLALLPACGQGNDPEPSVQEPPAQEEMQRETLRLELTHSAADEDTLMQALRTLPELLPAALAEQGVAVGRVETTVGASPAASAQALNDGSVDLAVLPGTVFAELGGEAVPLLTAAETADAEAGGRRMLLLAGPTEYGRQLSARAASGTPLTWDELDRAAWSVTGGEERGMVSVWLADRYDGNTLSNLSRVTYAETDGDGDGESPADVLAVPADTREGTNGAIGETEPYYSVILAARPYDGGLVTERFRAALAAALAQVCGQDASVRDALGGGALTALVEDDALNAMRRLATLGG